MVGFKVFAVRRKFLKFKRPIESALRSIGRAGGFKGKFLEVYLVDASFMNTNVLAFPAPKNFPRPDIRGEFLGEIYINPDYIKKEKLSARGGSAFGGEINAKLAYLLIHGFLHLLGYDHKRKSDRIKMERKEKELLKKLGY